MDASEYISSGRIGQALAGRVNRRSGTSYPVERFTFRVGPTAAEPGIFTHFRGGSDPCDCITIGLLHTILGSALTPVEAACLAEYARTAA